MQRSALLLAATGVALNLIHSPLTLAQSPSTESSSGIELEEIVVTAQKREESSQKTAISIATVQRAELERKGITNLDSALKEVTSVKITSSPQGEGGSVFIRGIGNNFLDPVISAQPAVAINVDGVINTQPGDILTSLFDVDRVEVLRGPQGTLYGSSAEAGVVNVVMAQPTHELEARGRLQVGNYNARVLEGMANLPIGDKLALRLVASDSKRDGYISGPGPWTSPLPCALTKDPSFPLYDASACTGTLADALATPSPSEKIPYNADNYGATGTTTYRGKLKYDPTEWLSLTGSYEHSQSKGTATQFVVYSDFLAGNTLHADSFVPLTSLHREIPTGNTSETFTLNAVATLGNFAQLTFLPSRKKSTPIPVLVAGAASVGATTQDTYELRLNSLPSSTFIWTLGAYKSKDDITIANASGAAASPAGSYSVLGVGHPFDTKNIFGQVTYPLTERLRITGGARYTRTKATYAYELYKTDQSGALDANGNPLITELSPLYKRSLELGNTSYKAGVEFDAAPASMLYAQVSTGFKAGGLGLPPASTAVPIASVADVLILPFKSETSTAFEVGSKNRFFDDRLQINGDIYYNQWKNMQLGSFSCRPGATCSTTPGDPNLISVVYNADTAKQYGLEVDVNWVVTPSDRIDLSVTAMHGTYGNLTENAFGTPYSLTGHKMSNTPSLAGSAGYSHVFTLRKGLTLTPRLDEQFSTSYFNTQEYWLAGSEVPGYGKTDVTLTLAGKNWSVNAYGRNLFNKIQAQFAHPLGVVPSEPRVFGVGVVGSF